MFYVLVLFSHMSYCLGSGTSVASRMVLKHNLNQVIVWLVIFGYQLQWDRGLTTNCPLLHKTLLNHMPSYIDDVVKPKANVSNSQVTTCVSMTWHGKIEGQCCCTTCIKLTHDRT